MLAEKTQPASHAGEDQSSPGFAARSSHWDKAQSGIEAERVAAPSGEVVTSYRAPWLEVSVKLLQVATAYAAKYLREERDDVRACIDTEHHTAVRSLFDAIKQAEAVDLAGTGPLKNAAFVGEPAHRAQSPRADHDAATLSNLVHANDLLAAGDMEFSAGGRTITFADLITADDIVLIMSERAQKLFGPNADGYPGVDKMQKGILDGALRGWIALCCPPDCLGAEINQDAAVRAENGGAQ